MHVEMFTLVCGARAPSAMREGKNFNTHFWAAMTCNLVARLFAVTICRATKLRHQKSRCRLRWNQGTVKVLPHFNLLPETLLLFAWPSRLLLLLGRNCVKRNNNFADINCVFSPYIYTSSI